ncbi:hypothetical protein SBOR_7854 [Sclerotinia borealis F-4128]|uniref:Uncharacterized protein n=1 Tax=Sclerotinia borealis (strain F-4128) TaxID=1432307 RepID=W9C4Q4_SCLBF|nr:hypothetical protein SBOR_7854 [Sclerotinia borealis F-4128]
MEWRRQEHMGVWFEFEMRYHTSTPKTLKSEALRPLPISERYEEELQSGISIALNPDSAHIVRAGYFECTIHPILHKSSAINPASLLLDLNLQSQGTRTTPLTQVVDRPLHIMKEAYYYHSKKQISVQGESDEWQWADNSRSSSPTVRNDEESRGALASLAEFGIEYNDVNEETILIGQNDGRYTAYLTGFSEYTIMKVDSKNLDMANLISTVGEVLPGSAGSPSCDPQWRSLILQATKGQMTAKRSSVQEVRGSSQSEGYYIDRQSATNIMLQHSLKTKNPWNVNEHVSSPSEFFGNNKEHCVAVVNDEMIGHLVVDRHLKSVMWNGRTMTLETARKECAEHGLNLACNTLHDLESSESTGSLFYTDDDILRLLEESDLSTAATYVPPTRSFDSDRFEFQPIDTMRTVDIIPPQHYTQRVEEWIAISPDMRRTRWGRRDGADPVGQAIVPAHAIPSITKSRGTSDWVTSEHPSNHSDSETVELTVPME